MKTIYPCVAENDTELSFDAGIVICNGESWKAYHLQKTGLRDQPISN